MATRAITIKVTTEQVTLRKENNAYTLVLSNPATTVAVGTQVQLIGSSAVGPIGPQGPTGPQGYAGITKSATAPSDTTVLWADTSTTGVTVATPFIEWQPGEYYGAVQVNVAPRLGNTTYFSPIYVPLATTVDRIGCLTSSSVGTTVARLGIYSNNKGIPKNLVVDAGTVSCSDPNTFYEITINQSLNPGTYWLAWNATSLGDTPSFYGSSAVGAYSYYQVSSISTSSIYRTIRQSVNAVSGFPSVASPSFVTGSNVALWVRAA